MPLSRALRNHALEEFLKENNAIEGVYDRESLAQAKIAWQFLIDQPVMSIHTVLKTHKILMLNQKLKPDEKGYFRRVPVWVGRREGMDWKVIPQAMNAWCDRVMISLEIPQVSDFEDDHIVYEKIHPFVDGNGRTGRMFWNWARIKVGRPLVIIHEGKEQMEYYKLFR